MARQRRRRQFSKNRSACAPCLVSSQARGGVLPSVRARCNGRVPMRSTPRSRSDIGCVVALHRSFGSGRQYVQDLLVIVPALCAIAAVRCPSFSSCWGMAALMKEGQVGYKIASRRFPTPRPAGCGTSQVRPFGGQRREDASTLACDV